MLRLTILFSILLTACSRVDVDYNDYGQIPVQMELSVETQVQLLELTAACESQCTNLRTAANNSKCQLFCIKATLVNGGR